MKAERCIYIYVYVYVCMYFFLQNQFQSLSRAYVIQLSDAICRFSMHLETDVCIDRTANHVFLLQKNSKTCTRMVKRSWDISSAHNFYGTIYQDRFCPVLKTPNMLIDPLILDYALASDSTFLRSFNMKCTIC